LELFPNLGKSLAKSKRSPEPKNDLGIKSQTQTVEGRTTTLDKTTTVHPVESNQAAHVETTVLEMTVETKTTVETKIIVQNVTEPLRLFELTQEFV
jgi:hypothetical protein